MQHHSTEISFENSINLGGENTHLDSKLRTVLSAFELDLDVQEPQIHLPLAATLKPETVAYKPLTDMALGGR